MHDGGYGFGESTFPGGGWMKWREGPNRPFRCHPGEALRLSQLLLVRSPRCVVSTLSKPPPQSM